MSSLVAVFQIGSLGDAIVSVPALLSIKDLVPGCTDYLLITAVDSKLKASPAEIFEMAWKPKALLNYPASGNRVKQALSVAALVAKLRYHAPKYCIGLMPAEREPERLERDKRFFRAAGIPNLLGFQSFPVRDYESAFSARLDGTEGFLRFERLWGDASLEKFPRYSTPPVLSPSPAAESRMAQWLQSNRRAPDKPLIALSPYSNFSSRDIPEHTIHALIAGLVESAEIVIVGGTKDSTRAAQLLSTVPGLNACGLFSVQESAALLKASALAICTESGPMHLAAAVGVPLLATFSRINKQFDRWLPFVQGSTILYREVPCAGCFSRQCPVAGHPCMQDIAANHLITAALNILDGVPVLDGSLNGTRVLNW